MTRLRAILLRFGLPAWTLMVWVPRIRNIWADDELAVGGQMIRTGWSVVFIVFALGALIPGSRRPSGHRRWMQAFVIWTVGFWAIRGTQIALGDHAGAFIAVHTVLALGSMALAWWSWPRTTDADRSEHARPMADKG